MAATQTKTVYLNENPYNFLKENEDIFNMINSRTATAYKVRGFNIIFSELPQTMAPHMFGAISHLKSNAIKYEYEKSPKQRKVNYFDFNISHEKRLIKNVVELDIKQAYWQSAYQMGLLSQKIFDNYANKKGAFKLARNMAIGNLYSEKLVYECDKKNDTYLETIPKIAPRTYTNICFKIDMLMSEVKMHLENDFYFYWVDAIFVKNTPSVISEVKRIIDFYDFNFENKGIFNIFNTENMTEVINPANLEVRKFHKKINITQ